MLLVWEINRSPCLRTGGANGGGLCSSPRFSPEICPINGLYARLGAVGHIDVFRLCLFEGEADVFTSTGDTWPVDELVGGVFGGLLAFGAPGRHSGGRIGGYESNWGEGAEMEDMG